MKSFRFIAVCLATIAQVACSSAKYRVIKEGVEAPVSEVEAEAPGGETYVLVVIYGATLTPTVKAGGDSQALVEATAAAGRMAIDIALKPLAPAEK